MFFTIPLAKLQQIFHICKQIVRFSKKTQKKIATGEGDDEGVSFT